MLLHSSYSYLGFPFWLCNQSIEKCVCDFWVSSQKKKKKLATLMPMYRYKTMCMMRQPQKLLLGPWREKEQLSSEKSPFLIWLNWDRSRAMGEVAWPKGYPLYFFFVWDGTRKYCPAVKEWALLAWPSRTHFKIWFSASSHLCTNVDW